MSISLRDSTRAYIFSSGQRLTTGVASVTSSAVVSSEVLLCATANMYININGTAANSAGSLYMTAGEKFHLQIVPGSTVSAIQDTAAGGLFIIPVF